MPIEYSRIYQELLDRIIEGQKNLYGELAVKLAFKVKELEVSEGGNVLKISGSPKDAIRSILREYEVLGGKLSRALGEAVVRAYHNRYPDMDLNGE